MSSHPPPISSKHAWTWVCSLSALIRREARRLVPPAEVDDLVAEVRVRLACKVIDGRLHPDGARDPDVWLRTIVRNTLRDAARSIHRRTRRFELCAAVEPPPRESTVGTWVADWRTWDIPPVDLLVLLALAAPEMVEEADVAAAVKASRPPDVGLSRSAAETWHLFDRWRRTPRPRSQRDLLFVLRGPPGAADAAAWDDDDAKRARNWAYTRRKRARQAARKAALA